MLHRSYPHYHSWLCPLRSSPVTIPSVTTLFHGPTPRSSPTFPLTLPTRCPPTYSYVHFLRNEEPCRSRENEKDGPRDIEWGTRRRATGSFKERKEETTKKTVRDSDLATQTREGRERLIQKGRGSRRESGTREKGIASDGGVYV